MIARWITHTAGDIEDQHQIRVLHLSRLACIGNSIGNGGIIADHNLQVTRATVATGIRSRHDETRTIRCITVALNVVSQHIVFERVGIIHRVDTGCGAADTGYRQHSFRIVDQGLTAATGQVVSLPTDGQGSQIFPWVLMVKLPLNISELPLAAVPSGSPSSSTVALPMVNTGTRVS